MKHPPQELIDAARERGFDSVAAFVEYFICIQRLFRWHKRGR